MITGCVEDFKHDLLAVVRHLLSIRVLDGGIVVIHELALDESKDKGRLAHASASQHHNLEFLEDHEEEE